MAKSVILCDVDGVLADCGNAVRNAAQKFVYQHGCMAPNGLWSTDYQIPPVADQKQFEYGPWLFPYPGDYKRFVGVEKCRDRLGYEINLFPGACEFVRDLEKIGEVVFCTSHWHGMAHWVPAREALLNTHFYGIDIVFTHAKHRVIGDILIDDRPCTVRQNLRGMLFDQPWNRADTDLNNRRYCGYEEVLEHLRGHYGQRY